MFRQETVSEAKGNVIIEFRAAWTLAPEKIQVD